MKVSEWIRNVSFWTIDFITGSKVRKHFLDIKYIIENPANNTSIERQQQYLNALLIHAVTTSDYYKEIDASDLLNFPVINKEIIKTSYDKIQSKKYINKKHISVSTSGSTGAPFTLYQDVNKKKRNTADVLYFSELSGFRLGYRLYYLRFWNMFKQKNKVTSFIQNVVPINVFDLTENSIKNLIEDLVTNTSYKGMLGYASVFYKICNYLDATEAKPMDCKLTSVIGISERLNPITKISMKKYFNVDMISRYSNAENGMLAQQPRGEDFFVINSASYFIEILDIDINKRVQNGTLGRIVITDLFNYNTPIIRYDTGDMGIMDYVDHVSQNKLVFIRIEGRKMDMIRDTSGNIVSTSILLIINKYKQIKERQIIQQTKSKYLFKLKLENNTFDYEKEFVDEFKEYLGKDAEIKLEYVDQIPMLLSGKHRAIINNVKN